MAVYNEILYNEGQYLYILFSEIISIGDSVVKDSDKTLSDFMFLTDSVTKQFSVKGLSDTIRLADWVTKTRPTEPKWTDK